MADNIVYLRTVPAVQQAVRTEENERAYGPVRDVLARWIGRLLTFVLAIFGIIVSILFAGAALCINGVLAVRNAARSKEPRSRLEEFVHGVADPEIWRMLIAMTVVVGFFCVAMILPLLHYKGSENAIVQFMWSDGAKAVRNLRCSFIPVRC